MRLAAFDDEAEFGPELLARMGIAFARACDALGLADKDDKLTELVAERVIAFARHGVHDPERLKAAVLASLRD